MKKIFLFVLSTFIISLFLLISPFNNASAANCSTKPTWRNVGHTDSTNSIQWQLRITEYCSGSSTYTLTASRPTSGWSYKYSGCSTNTPCTKTFDGSITVYLTITRPTGASGGDHTVTASADNSSISPSTIGLVYTVCSTCADKGYECGSFTNNCGATLSCGTCSKATCSSRQCIAWKYTCNKSTYTCSQTSSGTLTQSQCNTACARPTATPTASPTPTPTPRPTATPTPTTPPTPTPVPVSYACINWACNPVYDGSGYSTQAACNSNCVPPPPPSCEDSDLAFLAPAGIPTGGLCMINRMIQLGLNLLLIVSIIISIIFLIWGAGTWIISGGDKQKIGQAKQRLTLTVIGLIVVFVSFAILRILQFLFKVS